MRTLLYVGDLPDDTTAADLDQLFRQHGLVVATQIIADPESGQSLGFGFVEMAEGAEAAVRALHGTQFQGRSLTVREERRYRDDYTHRESPEMHAAIAELRERAEEGDAAAAHELAEIIVLPGPYYDPQAAYKWYYIALSQQGYSVRWEDHNHTPPHYCGPVGDFRNECMVSDLVIALGWKRIWRTRNSSELNSLELLRSSSNPSVKMKQTCLSSSTVSALEFTRHHRSTCGVEVLVTSHGTTKIRVTRTGQRWPTLMNLNVSGDCSSAVRGR